mmetsp:Transcript_2753/g.5022  ORF Transcript_2753/g.5022 Transcript_2753/m.5022 type:complete len:85 (-) Transcript_2753:136-390(-)
MMMRHLGLNADDPASVNPIRRSARIAQAQRDDRLEKVDELVDSSSQASKESQLDIVDTAQGEEESREGTLGCDIREQQGARACC